MTFEVTVHERRVEAQGVVCLDLRPQRGQAALPPFSAGAHVDVEVLVGKGPPLLRQYSLCNDPADTHRYVIGVSRDAASRGGSAALCEQIKAAEPPRLAASRLTPMT